ncbi:MAG: HDOD domain-containing protein [Deltaproteobacteria bacterium]|nr:HDOD domain-containing protein [Deltaproteobacteria bacterium]MBW1922855.1 HDOD domain-containing protein [Deltaproteobacteria bacterium]MBW1948246.1 HDOD domain-containing protein [Deltaproteobacteria bacterium]MBW2006592.1 HDOD domain-containing protein [Deltaproteobacteria bacterium]MBW2349202.1 HDOD domain-containing protein [Deltaproteobacteria bacterium]
MKEERPDLETLKAFKKLPSLPHILLKVLEACNDPKGSVAELSAIIEKDPALCGKILRVVNSTYFGLRRKVEGIAQAATLLGTNAVRNMVLCASVHEVFRARGSGRGPDLKRYWWHSLKSGILARDLARRVGYANGEEAFLAGLLHDLGKLVLWTNFPREYEELLERYESREELRLAAESKLGATHCQAGGWLLDRWGLPTFVADAVYYHHESLERVMDALPLVRIVFAANVLSQPPTAESESRAAEVLGVLFGLTAEQVSDMGARAEKEVEEVARSLQIEVSSPAGDDTNDQLKAAALEKRVQDMSLLLGTLQNLLQAHEERAILRVVDEGFRILFDCTDLFFFLHDPDKEALVGRGVVEEERSALVEGLLVPVSSERSLLVSCLRREEILNSFEGPQDEAPVIIDAQLIRFMGVEGMVCIPLSAHGESVGVVVLGLKEKEFRKLALDFSLLHMFVSQASLALYAQQLRERQWRRIQVERLEAAEAMARKVVHEANNPLGIMKNYLKILGMKLAERGIEQEEIRILNEEIDRVAGILAGLTAFTSRSGTRPPEPVDVNRLLKDLAKITRDSLQQRVGVTLHLDPDPSLPTVMADRDGLKQVVINLVKNAAEAMESRGGNIYLETRRSSKALEQDDAKGYVQIIIRDDGPGIPEEVKSKLFEPFVTSKGAGHSGLGLSIVHNLVKKMGGAVVCESEEGKGTRFRIEIPVGKQG